MRKSKFKFLEIFSIDPRALATFRVAMGLVLLFDFITKSAGLTAFFTDQGILPRSLAINNLGWWSFSFHMANGSLWFQSILMTLGYLFAIAMVIGYQTRIVTFLLWLFVLSLQNRNYLILHSGDSLIRLLLFWSMFLPLGNVWSLDRLNEGKTAKQTPPNRFACAGILLQMFSIYFFTALLKNHPDWNKNFTALYYAMNLEQYTTSFGQYLLEWPSFMKFLTATTYGLELVGPILVFVPFFLKYTRTIIPLMFIGFHFGLVATMNLGMFPFVCMAGWLLFLPPEVWTWLEKTLKIERHPFFKNLRKAGTFLLKHLPEPYAGRTPKWSVPVATGILIFSMVATITWNILTLPAYKRAVPEWIRTIALPLRLDQYWSMFAPFPMRGDGWYVVDGILNDGTSMDTWNGVSPSTFDKPDALFVGLRSTQWRKFLGNVWLEEKDEDIKLAFGKYVCREWNRLNGKREDQKKLKSYKLYYMRESTPPPGQIAVVRQNFLWQHECFASPEKTAPATPPAIKD